METTETHFVVAVFISVIVFLFFFWLFHTILKSGRSMGWKTYIHSEDFYFDNWIVSPAALFLALCFLVYLLGL